MERWRTRRADRALRLSGLVLLAVAGVALRWLTALHVPPQSAGVLAYGWARSVMSGRAAGRRW